MKNLSFILGVVLSLFLAGCTSDEPVQAPVPDAQAKSTTIAEKIAPEQAAEIAEQAAASVDKPVSRPASRLANVRNIEVLTGNQSRANAPDTLIYIVNYDNEKGYALISAYDIGTNVLAVIDSGHYPTDEEDTFEMFAYYIDAAKEYVDAKRLAHLSRGDFHGTIDPTIRPRPEEKTVIDTIYNVVVSPKLGDLQWGQDDPLNRYCPNGVVGCSPLSIAQAMAVIKPTQYIAYNFPNAPKAGEYIDWDLAWKHKKWNNTDYEANQMLSRLCRQIGQIASSEYRTNGTGTSTKRNNKKDAVKFFFPNKKVEGYSDYDVWDVISAIDKGIVIFSANLYINNVKQDAGHSWVGDGSWKYHIRYSHYERERGFYIDDNYGWVLKSEYDSADRYIHCNWGWDGNHDGYYLYEPFIIRQTGKPDKHYKDIQYLSIQ
jgi:hypothetical protein